MPEDSPKMAVVPCEVSFFSVRCTVGRVSSRSDSFLPQRMLDATQPALCTLLSPSGVMISEWALDPRAPLPPPGASSPRSVHNLSLPSH